jgi:hypothetical protein
MTRRQRQIILILLATMVAMLIAVFLMNLDVVNDPAPPREIVAMGGWMQKHPADWLTAAEISDAALDSSVPRRAQLWRASYALALHLSPRLQNAPGAFVRAGLFHWYELGADDRKAVLDVAAPLLHDNYDIFNDLHEPLWDLTHDFDYILRNAPPTVGALDSLRLMTANRGLFADYRKTRAALDRERLAAFREARTMMAPHELPSLLPPRLSMDDEPLVRAILEELHNQSFTPEQFRDPTSAMIEFAVDHNVEPLDALSPFIEADIVPPQTRARLALALDRADVAATIELAGAHPVAPEWVRYRAERALYEAKHGNASAVEIQLRHAFSSGADPLVLATAMQTAELLQNDAAAAQYRRQLAAFAKAPREWSPNCGHDEVCDWGSTRVYSTGSIDINAAVVQSDRIPPYVEIYADDARVAEGEVDKTRRFTLPLASGVHRIEVRLINPRIGGSGFQRRVRLS